MVRDLADRWRLTLLGVPITVVVALLLAGPGRALLSGVIVGIGTVVIDTWVARDREGRS
ncbi:MAG TPA: hypothetical protein VE522_03140 [Actinomycetota bacterium]|nr:hypothetical protein [Actinomycetota bacterium]